MYIETSIVVHCEFTRKFIEIDTLLLLTSVLYKIIGVRTYIGSHYHMLHMYNDSSHYCFYTDIYIYQNKSRLYVNYTRSRL